MPGLGLARVCRREWLRNDLIAAISVAAVALPIGIAYAQLVGFAPVVGIYSCILPPVAYALFGSSRQLIANPDLDAFRRYESLKDGSAGLPGSSGPEWAGVRPRWARFGHGRHPAADPAPRKCPEGMVGRDGIEPPTPGFSVLAARLRKFA